LPVAAQQGFKPDGLVCTGDTPEGRPTPFMLYKTLLDLKVWPAWSVIKVDDTEVGIAEGINGGAWTVGVSVSGNCFGLSREDTEALAPADFMERRAAAMNKLARAGAHYVIDSVADLMPIARKIEERLERGERP
jgi:phosphonoacetaldehyde hydrolase